MHNGIIENYAAIKERLQVAGMTFRSDTDTEVLVQLIEYEYNTSSQDIVQAVRRALQKVEGAYAVAVLDNRQPDTIVSARKGSPLVIGVGEDELFIGSDASPIVEYTNRIIYLNDGEMAVLRKGQFPEVTDLDGHPRQATPQRVELTVKELEKGGYEHFMLKEIAEQPASLRACMQGRVRTDSIWLDEIETDLALWQQARRLVITACGTSYYAGLAGKYALEDLAGIPVEVDYASEFRYRNPVLRQGDIVVAISQSGETADTLAAVELAKQKGIPVVSVCNVMGSSIPRASDKVLYTRVGSEIGVASTKAFTAQVTVLTLLAIRLARMNHSLTDQAYHELVSELNNLPDKVSTVLKQNEAIRHMAKGLSFASNVLYIGRNYNYATALEGALKLKEISYIHAEGYPAAEMKHGPIALISQEMPVVVIATQGKVYDKLVSNIQEIRARHGRVMAVVTEGDTRIVDMADASVAVPAVSEALSPLLTIVPLQLLAYHVACLKGCNVDQPRNLAKSVTVE